MQVSRGAQGQAEALGEVISEGRLRNGNAVTDGDSGFGGQRGLCIWTVGTSGTSVG